jgi:hypothetical protein
MAGEQDEYTGGLTNQLTRPAPDSVRASLPYSYVEAGRSGIFIMISSAPSLYRYAH